MARGRMLNKSVSASVKLNNLPDDTCRLLATWTIAHLDVRGVFYGDAAMVKSFIFPRRADITVEQVQGYLEDMQAAGLLCIFESNGDIWQYWTGFAHNQVGLRADRESSHFPIPPGYSTDDTEQLAGELPETIQQDTGELPAEEKLSEVEAKEKLREDLTPSADATAPNLTPPEPKPSQSKSEKPKAKAPIREDRAMFGALASLCYGDTSVMSNKMRGILNSTGKTLRNGGAKPADCAEFSTWWYACDWRGKNQQKPTPALVVEKWGAFIEWRKGGKIVQSANRRSSTILAASAGGDGGHNTPTPEQLAADKQAVAALRKRQQARAGAG